MTENPCAGCVPPKRTATCHATCPSYAAFDAANRERRKALYCSREYSDEKERSVRRYLKHKLRRGEL